MSELHKIEIEFDDHCYQALLAESARLGLPVEQVIGRAAAAWVTDLAENTVVCTPTVTLVS